MLRLLNLSRRFCSVSTNLPKHKFKFQYGWHMVPHPQKAYKGGEDAVFVSENVLLVADGVGGWAQSGVDPALYSKKLAKIVQELVKKDNLKYIEDPKLLIKQAVELNKEVGSTTVCVLTLHPQSGILNTYYLGDSVFAIIDPSNQGFRIAEDQQYQFNFPVQIGTNGADPGDGVFHSFKPEDLSPGEIIVIGSDGIWDNLQHFMIYSLVSTKDTTLTAQAEQIASFAMRYGSASNYESPFHLKAKQHGISYPKQGKLDDCSVIVAKIIKEIF